MESPVSLADLKQALVMASEIVRRWFGAQLAISCRGDGSPVTRAVQETGQFLRESLAELLPSAEWLCEQSEDRLERLDAEWIWLVEPLDGTKEFLRRIPEVAISVGLVHWNDVVLGGIMNPLTHEGGVGTVAGSHEFWGMGNANRHASSLADAVVSVSRTELEKGSILPYLGGIGRAKSIGSSAYKLLRVAAGRDDLTFSLQAESEWDICGGLGLLLSTGKIYRRLDGEPCLLNQRNPFLPSGTVAGSEPLVNEMLTRLPCLPPSEVEASYALEF